MIKKGIKPIIDNYYIFVISLEKVIGDNSGQEVYSNLKILTKKSTCITLKEKNVILFGIIAYHQMP